MQTPSGEVSKTFSSSALVRRCVAVSQATISAETTKMTRYQASSSVTAANPCRGTRMKNSRVKSERTTANKPGPTPPYHALTMMAGMKGVPRIPGRPSASVTSNASATLTIASP